MATTSEHSSSLPAVASSSRQNDIQGNFSGRIQRPVISCFSCRHKKLKCDRARPCSSCVKRGLSCAYATPTERPSAPNRGGNTQLYDRIRHLENLVASLVKEGETGAVETASSQPAPLANGSSSSKTRSERIDETVKNNGPASEQDSREEYVQEFGHMRMSDSEITYVSATHWTAIRDNITSIREYIEAGDEQYNSTQALFEGPSLLLGICTPSSIVDILFSLPPRPTVDRLVSRYFNSGEPSVLIFHIPTFQREYERFWASPEGTPITWISLLFSVMCLGVFLHLQSGEDPPDMSCPPKEAANTFRLRAVECLIRGDYTKPKAYTIESLLLHTQCEYFGRETAQTGVWILWGMVVRLALFVGLHRDSKHFPEISCFEGEMRRRKWALITQLDLLISYQAGLPRMVRDGEGDTELPRNLLDEDFDKSSTELPPPRSDTEATPVSYSIYKGKISHVFGLVVDRTASSIRPPSMETLIELDRKLTEAYSSIPPHLQLRGSNLSVTDSPTLIMRRYTIDCIYHKACCLLHRRYFDLSPSANHQYKSSRTRCLNSATRLLKHQATVNQEIQPGGLLYRDKWFASSIMSNDFLLAAMIICLELQHIEKNGSVRAASTNDHDPVSNGDVETHSKEELLQALEISHDIWSLSASQSKEAAKATQALASMLKKVKNIPNEVDDAGIHTSSAFSTSGLASLEREQNSARKVAEQDPDFGSIGEEWMSSDQERLFNEAFGIPEVGNSHLDGVEVMADIDLSTDMNWHLWDSQVQNIGMHPEWMTEQEFLISS